MHLPLLSWPRFLPKMTEIDNTTPLDEILATIQPNLIPLHQIEKSGCATPAELLRAMSAMQGILVLTSVIDVQLLPESERGIVGDLRETAALGHSLAHDLIAKRSPSAMNSFLDAYEDALDSAEYLLNLVNQRMAFRFGRMTECKMTK